jgi:cytochrome c oxidase assembly protein subunit 15
MTTLLKTPELRPPTAGYSSPPATGGRWLHVWAWVTVAATVPLLILGAKVTSFQVGMADPVWPTAPGYLFRIDWVSFGRVLEDSHREVGYLVGICTIVLAIGAWAGDRRRWIGWFGTAILLDVILQGLLGGFRVSLNALVGTDLALIHGVHAQLAFGLMVAFAVVTSRGWAEDVGTLGMEAARPLRRAAALLLGSLVVQLILGAWLRHVGSSVSQRLHLLMAFVIVSVVVGILRVMREGHAQDRVLMRCRAALMGLLGLQILLGVEAWMLRFGAGRLVGDSHAGSVSSAITRSTHVLIGAFLLATAVIITLRIYRLSYRSAVPPRRANGAAVGPGEVVA